MGGDFGADGSAPPCEGSLRALWCWLFLPRIRVGARSSLLVRSLIVGGAGSVIASGKWKGFRGNSRGVYIRQLFQPAGNSTITRKRIFAWKKTPCPIATP